MDFHCLQMCVRIYLINEFTRLYANQSTGKDQTVIDNFLKATETAYINCAKKLQTKMPLNNKLLRAVAAIDPTLRGHLNKLG